MQFALIKYGILCAALGAGPWLLPVQAQELRKNEKGEQIIVYPDGTWQFFADYLNGEEQRNPAGSEGSALEAVNYPTYTGVIAPLDGNIPVTQDDLFKIALRRSQIAREASAIAEQRAKKAVEATKAIEEELKQLLARGAVSESVIQQLNIRLNAARRAEEEALLEADYARQEAGEARQLTEKGRYIAAYQDDLKKRQASGDGMPSPAAYRTFDKTLPLSENYAQVLPNEDVILHPPPPDCRIAFEGRDENAGQWRRQMPRQLLFSYTDDRLRLYLKGKEYLRCEGYFSAIGGYRFLTLEFTFAYPNAREAYGFIEEGSVLTIRMLNGNFVNLRSGKMDRGSYDTEKEILTYQVYYPIDRSLMNLLKQSEVDSIRVFWSSGFEEYPVYQLDFFMQQINCLER